MKTGKGFAYSSEKSSSPPRRGKGRLAGGEGHARNLGLAVFLIFLFAVILYANSVGNHFIFDDYDIFVNKKEITSFTYLPKVMGLYHGHPEYRPVRLASYMVDYFFSGKDPAGYHIFNILYHIITSIFVYLVSYAITKSRRISLCASLIFVIHPLQTESVTYISGRRDILFSLFYFMGFYYFLKYRSAPRTRYAFLIFFFYILSLFSKEMGVTFPVLAFCYDCIERMEGPGLFRRVGAAAGQAFSRFKALYSSLFTLAFLYSMYKTVISNPSNAEGYYGGSLIANLLTVAKILTHHIKLLFFPLTLSADYSYDAFPVVKSVFEVSALGSVLVLLAVFLLLLKALYADKRIAFAGIWFFVTLLPTCHIVPHHELMAEHHLYLPMFGFGLFFAVMVDYFLRFVKWRLAGYAIIGLMFLFLSVRTIVRNADWKDDLNLWTKTVKTSPMCARARNNLAGALMLREDYLQAIRELREAIAIRPDYAEAYCNLGVSLEALNRGDEADRAFRRALAINPEFAEARYNLALLIANKGAFSEAEKEFKKSLDLKPDLAAAHFNLGIICRKTGKVPEALDHFRRVLAIDSATPTAGLARDQISELSGKQGGQAWNP